MALKKTKSHTIKSDMQQ